MGSIVILKGETPVATYTHEQLFASGGTIDISHLPFNDQTIREANGGRGITVSHSITPHHTAKLRIERVFSQQLVEGREREIVVSPILYGFPHSVIINTGNIVRHERS